MNGKSIRKYRMQCGLSQQQLADALGVSLEKILCWEKNLSQPSLDEMQQLVQYFQTHTQNLPAQNEPSQRKKPFWIPILAISLALILVCILLWQYIGRDPKDGNESLREFTVDNITVPTTTAPPATQASEPTAATQPPAHILTQSEIETLFKKCVVQITGVSDASTRTGLGFYINTSGTIVTNYRLVEGCYQIKVTENNGYTYDVGFLSGYSKECDIAILSTGRRNTVPLNKSMDPVSSEAVVYALKSFPDVNSGLIECGITDGADSGQLLTVSVVIPKEAAGGPLLDPYGKLVGITVSQSGKALPVDQLPPIGISQTSLKDFFLETHADVREQYTPQWAGSFASIGKLQEAQKRNPLTFEKPVTVSVTGVIVRTSKDEIYLLPYNNSDTVSSFEELETRRLIMYHSDNPELIIANMDTKYRIYMKDDTANRALTGDVVTITGTYRHNWEIIIDCTYKYIKTIP